MLENFRKDLADTIQALPKEERKEFADTVQKTEVYEKAKEEHQSQIKENKSLEDSEFERLANPEGLQIEVEVGGSILEFGPDLGCVSWNSIQKLVDGLNGKIKSGGELWRVPTKEEYDLIAKKMLERKSTFKYSEEFAQTNHLFKGGAEAGFGGRYFEGFGFNSSEVYWTSSQVSVDALKPEEGAYIFSPELGGTFYRHKDREAHVRCVR